LVQMAGSPLLAAAILLLVAVQHPRALTSALPVLLLWMAAPFLAYALSQPAAHARMEASPEDRRFLRLLARKTWRYFDTFVGAGDRGLPPDNVQDAPELTIAHRTSPTNIGMSLLAALAAHDLGFIATSELVATVETALDTIDGM